MPEMIQLADGSFLDRQTGDKYSKEQYTVMLREIKMKLRKRFAMLFQESFISLAMDREIRGEARSILDLMVGMMAFENKIPIHQAKIAEKLKITPCKVSLAIKKLLKKGIIEKDFTEGRNQFYKLSLDYGWKGKPNNFYKQKMSRLKINENTNK